MVRSCCVVGCNNCSHDRHGNKNHEVKFFSFPAWKQGQGAMISDLSKTRRMAWVSAVGRPRITFEAKLSNMLVCSRHFHTGRPVHVMGQTHPDWAPSLHLGHTEGEAADKKRCRKTKKLEGLTATVSPSDVDENTASSSVAPQGSEQHAATPVTPSHGGKPAYERLESDPDWAPSLELGHDEGNGKFAERFCQTDRDKETKKKKRKEKMIKKKKELKKRRLETPRAPIEEAAAEGDATESASRVPVNDSHPWSEVRSLFLSVLKNEPISSQRPADQTHKGAMHVGKEADFRDFFRKSLEESLENFSKSRAPSAQEPPIYVELKEDLSLRILPVETTSTDSSSSSSPSCGSCVRLQRKVVELQEELSLLSGVQEDVDVTPVAETTQLHEDQVPQSPEKVQAEEKVSDRLKSPKRRKRKRQKLSPSNHNSANTNSPKDKPRSIQRFRKAWFRMFDFLRYSPSLNIMWCHICRLYHDEKHKDNGMIKGSRCLKLDNIKNHNASMYHKKNMERHRKHMSDPNSLDSNRSNRSSEENITNDT